MNHHISVAHSSNTFAGMVQPHPIVYYIAALILLDPRHQHLLQKRGTKLPVFPGFNSPNLMISGGNTTTPQHKEDVNAAAMNLLLGGACKAWCVITQSGMHAFEVELKRD